MNKPFLIVPNLGNMEIHKHLFNGHYSWAFSGSVDECAEYCRKNNISPDDIGTGYLTAKPIIEIS